MAEGVQVAEIHTCLCSLWGQCSFSGKCVRIDRNVKELPDICDWCWTLKMTIYVTGDNKMEEASDVFLYDGI